MASFHSPMRTTAVSRITDKTATNLPPIIAAISEIAMMVMYQGESARRPSIRFKHVDREVLVEADREEVEGGSEPFGYSIGGACYVLTDD